MPPEARRWAPGDLASYWRMATRERCFGPDEGSERELLEHVTRWWETGPLMATVDRCARLGAEDRWAEVCRLLEGRTGTDPGR